MTYRDRDIWPDNPAEAFVWVILFLAILTIVVIFLSHPEVFAQIRQDVVRGLGNAPEATVENQIFLHQDDVEFMNRIYHERTFEIAYCGIMSDAVIRPWLADTYNESPTTVEFSLDNCPFLPGEERAVIHTHPSGRRVLSRADQQQFILLELDYFCVQGGRITTEVGASTANLRCWKRSTSNEASNNFERADVVVIPCRDCDHPNEIQIGVHGTDSLESLGRIGRFHAG